MRVINNKFGIMEEFDMDSFKVSMIFPPHMRDDVYYCTPPIGILSIAAMLEKEDIKVNVFDFVYMIRNGDIKGDKNIYNNAVKMILDSKPDVVGFYTQCVTYPTCINMAKKIKEKRPDIKILFGGHNSSFLDIETLSEFNFVDFVSRGEGEISAVNLIKAIRDDLNYSTVNGITYRNEQGRVIRNKDEKLIEDLDSLPIPALHLVPSLEEYRKKGETLTILIESGRGCIYNCIFCSNCRLWNHKVRYKSIKKVIEEIKYYHEFNPDEYYLVHDFFTYDEKYVQEFCDSLKESNLEIKWNCRCRLNVSVETLKKMRKTGCERLLYGVESGSPKMLQVMHKSIRFEDVYESIKRTIEAGILPSLSFVIGLKEETVEDLNMTLNLILKAELIGDCYPFMQIISPLPGTPVVENYSYDLRLETSTAFSRGIEYDGGSRLPEDQRLIEEYPKMFSSFYNVNAQIDLTYLHEISRAFCVIQQMFAYIYFEYEKIRNLKEIEVYNIWRSWVYATQKIDLKKIDNLTDRDIWNLFDIFLAEDEIINNSIFLTNLYQYSHVRKELIVSDYENDEAFAEFDINVSEVIQKLKKHDDNIIIVHQKEKVLFKKQKYQISVYKCKCSLAS